MADDVPTQGPSEDSPEHEDLPDRQRVHALARALGTTSRRVLDALTELDGRTRSAHSSVDRTDAIRVRDLLAGQDGSAGDPDEPESRLMPETTSERAEYMPLFVAPQPVEASTSGPGGAAASTEDTEDTDDTEDTEDTEDTDDIEDIEDTADADPDTDQNERPANRRRRRGRRGRGRGRGEQNGSDTGVEGGADTQTGEQSDSGTADDTADEEDGASEGASRRRRRRRRRKSGSGDSGNSGASSDDPPNTVVHERSPRSAGKSDGGRSDKDNSEIKGISGSTRLEAKRQRRRDGRDAGRRRPPILSEAEFLARREAVERVMVVRDRVRSEPPHEGARYTQIAVLEDGVVVEHFVTSAASASLVGNIYLGIVQNVLPSMEAAFVDIGRGRNGVLYAGEVNWEAAGLGGSNRKIEKALKPGDYVVAQVSKDPVGHKGARLTTQVSLAGRYLVYVPDASSTGISRKLPDSERQRLKEILREVVPADAGVIIRTASEGVKEDGIRADVTRLQDRWVQIDARAAETKANAAGAAATLYEEPDVLVKVIRDLFNEDFSGLIVSGDEAWNTINEYVSSVAPELVSKLNKYEPPSSEGQPGPDVFAVHRIDEQLAKAVDRKVWLPSGGSLVIDRTEAMTVVDVNTGKFTGSGGNLEQTVTKNNLEAAEEVVRQLRLRDIGGIIVIDFIDMVLESNRDLVLRRLTEALARDRTRHQVSEVTSLGLVQLTRKRLGTGLIEAFSTSCPQCSGRGILLHTDPVDSATSGRKSESGGRRGRRSKKARAESEAVKVPEHAPGEHPMFKAMAAANGKEDGEESTEELGAESDEDPRSDLAEETVDEAIDGQNADETGTEDADDLDEDSDEEDIAAGLDDDDSDDDIEELDIDDSDDSDDDSDSDSDDDSDVDEASVPAARPRRRRAAARPAGPPIHEK